MKRQNLPSDVKVALPSDVGVDGPNLPSDVGVDSAKSLPSDVRVLLKGSYQDRAVCSDLSEQDWVAGNGHPAGKQAGELG